MSTEELREAISVFGFTGVEKMNREQLLKKMLAIKSYLDRQKKTTDDNDSRGKSSSKTSEQNSSAETKSHSGKDWSRHWEEEIRRGMRDDNRSDIKKVIVGLLLM